jgi:selT/selW/selH-like putative selenoprotein
LKKKFDLEIEFKKSDGGRFEVYLDDEIVFSKMKEYRFPNDGEVEELLEKRLS